jgi:hypothetical protein
MEATMGAKITTALVLSELQVRDKNDVGHKTHKTILSHAEYDFPKAVRVKLKEKAGQLIAQCYDSAGKKCGVVVNPASVHRY